MFRIVDSNIFRSRDVESREILENEAYARLGDSRRRSLGSLVRRALWIHGSDPRIVRATSHQALVGAQFNSLARPVWLPSYSLLQHN